MIKIQTLFVSFLYHFFRRVVSLLMASKTAINLSSSSVTISDGIGLKGVRKRVQIIVKLMTTCIHISEFQSI